MKRSNAILLFLTLFLLAACTNARFFKREMFAEYGARGQAKYYRVTVEGRGINGQLDYRSGWYKAKAVDALFGNVSAQQDVESATALRRKRAIERTFDAYMNALEATERDPTKIDAARNNYKEAMQGVAGVTAVGEKPTAALSHADEKFLMVLSNNPEKIIGAIKGKTQQFGVEETLGQILASRNRSQNLKNKIRFKILAAQAKNVQASLESARKALGESAEAEVLRGQIEALLHELEAVR